ncbi:hypothetical protein BOX15_Mlig014213g3 [Macrostomum lignano]|uniref:PDZ domain-containing protein n=1 Tax=Macrostomum lignano TaxID=282301 RepID=A0A267EFZ3_9PLAT|nr:hypothetical protein BOX15_Mlig014213g3 [Macrostomum lignano]
MLNTDWTEIEVIDLISDSSGLGFGIIGSKSTGVVVRTILSGGAADTDGRLRSGDHLLCIGLVSVRGMNSEQVASVLRQSGDRVRLVVARVIHDPAAESTVGVDGRCCQLVPTGELEAHLEALVAALDACAAASAEEEQEEQQAEAPSVDDSAGAAAAAAAATAPAVADVGAVDAGQESSVASSRRESASHHGSNHRVCDGSDSSAQNLLTEAVQLHQPPEDIPASCFENPEASPSNGQAEAEEEQADSKEQEMSRLSPDEEMLWVDLEKGSQGLGITIAGYVGETLESKVNGIFVKSVAEESAAGRDGRLKVNDRIVEVDNQSLDGLSNHEAVELLKRTGSTVRLKVLRYRRGPVFDQLQAGTANTPPPLHRSVSVTAATRGGQTQAKRHQQPLRQAHSLQATSGDGSCCDENDAEFKDRRVTNSTAVSVEAPTDKPLTDEEVEAARARWCSLLAEQEPDCEVVVARLTKFKDCPGLGVSLEGTVELLADGRTLLPRHCIRALLPDGPAGREGSLRLGDELLEVNGHRLHGLNHLEVVEILKSLPQHVCVICSRKRPTQPKQNLTGQLKKQTGMAAVSANNSVPGAKSRSFDNFSGMGVWSDSPTVVELEKTTRGLGFSVLDYQDPLCPEDSAAVIIVRSLVPNGAAHRDGRILPGDRLLFVNDVSLERASLEEAVRCLKAAPLGRIVLGVAKPCPLLALAAAGSGTASGGGGAVGSKAAVRGVKKAGVSPTVASAAARKSLCHVSTSQLADITDGNWRPATAASTPSPPSSSSSSSTFDPQRADNRVSDDPEQLDSRLRLHSIEEDAGAPAITPTASAPAASESSFPVTPPPDESTTKSDDTQARVDTIQDESIDGQSSAASATPDSEQLSEFSSELVRRALDNVLAQCAEERLVCHRLVSEVLDEAQRRINAELQQQLEIVVNNVNGSVESSLSSSGSEQSLISSSSSGDMLGDLERLRDCGSDTDALFNHLEQTTDADEPAEYDDFGDQNSAISFQHRWLDDTPPPAPESLERSVRLSKTTDFEDLGLALESVDKGVNGCVVRDLTPGGPADRCGQIRLGDFVISINSECTRRVPTAQARAILRRAALVNQDVSISYLSADDVASHLESVRRAQTTARQQDPSILAPNNVRTSPEKQQQPQHPQQQQQSLLSNNLPPKELPVPHGALNHVGETPQQQAQNDNGETSHSNQQRSLAQDGSPAIRSLNSWGSPRLVRVRRDDRRNLGISIVGGKVAGHGLQQSVCGIFIKHVSEAGADRREGVLRTGDRILEVGGRDLRDATHDEAVEVIRGAPSPVEFWVQSLVNPACPTDTEAAGRRPTPDKAAGLHRDSNREPAQPSQQSSRNSQQPDGTEQPQQQQPQPQSPPQSEAAGAADEAATIDSNSRQSVTGGVTAAPDPGNEADNDDEEDEYDDDEEDSDEGVEESAAKRLAKKYTDANGDILVLNIDKRGQKSLGLSLAGNRDPSVMSVFVCGLIPDGAAVEDGRLKIGDELLEVNNQVLLGKSHLNAAPLINSCKTKTVKLVVVRRPTNIDDMAVKPVSPPKSVPIDYKPADYKQPDGKLSPAELEALAVPGASSPDAAPVGPYGVELQCIIPKGKHGLGFAIMERSLEDELGIYVKHITDGGPASTEGTLRTGDRMIRANEFDLAEASYDDALDKLRSMSGRVAITVARKTAVAGDKQPQQQQQQQPPVQQPPAAAAKPKKEVRITTPAEEAAAAAAAVAVVVADSDDKKASEPTATAVADGSAVAVVAAAASTEEPPEEDDSGDTNPATRKILRGRETLIELDKGDSGSLGVGIVGGSDTGLKSIIVHEIMDSGAASKDGRLAEGDQLISLDGKDLSALTHEEAKAALLQADKRPKLKVFRSGKGISEAQLYDIETIELAKKPSRGLGFSIIGRSRDQGVLVSDIIRGGAAESDGRLQPGDRLLEINGANVRTVSHSDVATKLKAAQGRVTLLIGRLKHVGASSKVKRKTEYTHFQVSLRKTDKLPDSYGLALQTTHPCHAPLHSVVAQQTFHSDCCGDKTLGIFVASLTPKGAAAKSGKILPGDELLSINGNQVDDKLLADAAKQLREASSRSGTAVLVFRRYQRTVWLMNVTVVRSAGQLLGFSIVGGRDCEQGEFPVCVKSVSHDSPARGRLFRGDEILSVNGRPLAGVTHAEAVSALKCAVGETVLTVLRTEEPAGSPNAGHGVCVGCGSGGPGGSGGGIGGSGGATDSGEE